MPASAGPITSVKDSPFRGRCPGRTDCDLLELRLSRSLYRRGYALFLEKPSSRVAGRRGTVLERKAQMRKLDRYERELLGAYEKGSRHRKPR
jgi:hypothetical protein